MPVMEQPACILNAYTPNSINDVWCVYEHHMVFKQGAPPELVYVASCKLTDLFQMREARSNSEWARLATQNLLFQIRVVATANNKSEAFTIMDRHMRKMPQMPRCNLHGFSMFRANRQIICGDGRKFASQAEAARALGCSQGAISQHLNGHIPSIKGVKLAYVRNAQ